MRQIALIWNAAGHRPTRLQRRRYRRPVVSEYHERLGIGDFNGDGIKDILWQNTTSGNVSIWLMNGANAPTTVGLGVVPTATYAVLGIGDFNGDGTSDILWQNTTNSNVLSVWLMNTSAGLASVSGLGVVPSNFVLRTMNAE